MKDELIKQVIEIIKSTQEFAISQLPDVARQAIIYGRIINILEAIGGIVLVGLVLIFGKMTVQKTRSKEWDEFAWAPMSLFGVFGGMAGIIVLADGANDGIQAWFAPKLYLLHYLTSLVKH